MPDDLDQRTGPTAEYEQIADVGITLEALLNHQRQTLHAFAHIGVAHRDPHPRARRDHRSAFNAAAASAGGADAKMLTWLRSEEHTSELQSLMRNSYAVFCLKTKNKKTSK